MGSFRVGIAFTKCPKCDYKSCIVDVWDRDYEGIKEEFYCLNCNGNATNIFLRQYIHGKIWAKISRASNSVSKNQEEDIAKAILEILNFDDDGNFSSNSLLQKLSGLRKFKPEEIFNFQLVREKVFDSLKSKNEEQRGIK